MPHGSPFSFSFSVANHDLQLGARLMMVINRFNYKKIRNGEIGDRYIWRRLNGDDSSLSRY